MRSHVAGELKEKLTTVIGQAIADQEKLQSGELLVVVHVCTQRAEAWAYSHRWHTTMSLAQSCRESESAVLHRLVASHVTHKSK
jgi:hypothetical protein